MGWRENKKIYFYWNSTPWNWHWKYVGQWRRDCRSDVDISNVSRGERRVTVLSGHHLESAPSCHLTATSCFYQPGWVSPSLHQRNATRILILEAAIILAVLWWRCCTHQILHTSSDWPTARTKYKVTSIKLTWSLALMPNCTWCTLVSLTTFSLFNEIIYK